MTSFADQVAERINCYGLSSWLHDLAQANGKTLADLLPVAAVDRHEIQYSAEGCVLIFRHPHAGHAEVADLDRWVLETATFDSTTPALPFGLDAQNETPQSARKKLADDTVEKDNRVSYFLPDARVVELTFSASRQTIVTAKIVRLGVEQEFTEATE